ncbi:MAG: DsrE family protein [Chromatiaceae bacterium]|nr:DsrE family protein [Chromatiaceae bacterium]
MKNIVNSIRIASLVILGMLAIATAAQAQDDKVHKIVIQVSHPDPAEHAIALNMASNLQKLYGMDNIKVEIVAFGQGLEILTPKSAEAARVKSMVLQDVRFSACANTMDKIERKTGKRPELTEGVEIVPAGVGRIMELQEQGYAYAAP